MGGARGESNDAEQGEADMNDDLIFSIEQDVAAITINRERRRNALNDATIIAMMDALERCKDPKVRAIILTGAGTKAFSAGSDIKEMAEQTYEQRLGHTELGQALGNAIEHHPCPVIAAIEGYCLGGGLEIAIACDYRIAGARAILGLPEVTLSALPSWGGTTRMPRLVGIGRARQLVIFGKTLDAQTALEWGLIGEVVPEGAAFKMAMAMAIEFAEKTDRRTVSILKRLIGGGLATSAHTGLTLEYLADMTQLSSAALDTGVAKFTQKKEPGGRP